MVSLMSKNNQDKQRFLGRQSGHSGFTLLELLIALLMVAILAVIAVPNYLDYVDDAHRSRMTASLLRIAALEERYYTNFNSYCTDSTTCSWLTLDSADGGDRYTILVNTDSATSLTTITASLKAGIRDRCGNLTYVLDTQTKGSGSGTVAECWGGS